MSSLDHLSHKQHVALCHKMYWFRDVLFFISLFLIATDTSSLFVPETQIFSSYAEKRCCALGRS